MNAMTDITRNDDPRLVRVLPHFRKRVAERIGTDVDPVTLAVAIAHAVLTRDYDRASYVGRGDTPGTACYRIQLPDGRIGYPVVCTATGTPITILAPGFLLARRGKRRPKRLREYLPETDNLEN